MVAVFPSDDNLIWSGANSLFNFPSNTMEFQNIYSEINSFTTSYLVNTTPFIILNCIADDYKTEFSYNGSYSGFQNFKSLNDYKIDIPNSPATGYILNDYYSAIQNSFNNLKQITDNQIILTIGNTHDLNPSDTSFNTYISCNINKIIKSDNFYLDISNSFLNVLGFEYHLNTGENKITISSEIINSGIIITKFNNKFHIYPQNNGDNRLMKSKTITIQDRPTPYNLNTLIEIMNNSFISYNTDNINLSKTSISYKINSGGKTIDLIMNLNIEAVLTNKDYNLYFFEDFFIIPTTNVINPTTSYSIYNCYNYSNTYYGYGNTPLRYYWLPKDTSYNNTVNTWSTFFGFTDPSYSLANTPSIKGKITNESNLLKITNNNNYFQLRPLYDPSGGVYDEGRSNIITYTLSSLRISNINGNLYTKEQITEAINIALNAPNSIAIGSYIDISNPITLIRLNINKIFSAKDYSVIFYDENSFTKCNYGPGSSAEITTADTTLGWKMGFRSNSVYNLTYENLKLNLSDGTTHYGESISNPYSYDPITRVAKLTGDTSVNVNLYNYFLIVLDDYTQNHLNDGLITTVNADMDISLPSYGTKSSNKCIVPSGKYGISDTTNYNNYNRLTNAQVYSANQILNTQKMKYLNNIYSSGPFIQDIFGIIPVKTAGLSYGQTYSEFGGTLQIQERVYFGPVNISRMTVRIMTDKGNILDLNNQNWSFSLITEQLYNPNRE